VFRLIYMIRNFNILFLRRQNWRFLIPNLISVINTFSDIQGSKLIIHEFLDIIVDC